MNICDLTSVCSTQVPFGSLAFMPGKLVHTNEITVLLGDNWFAKCSAKQAQRLVTHRMERKLFIFWGGFFVFCLRFVFSIKEYCRIPSTTTLLRKQTDGRVDEILPRSQQRVLSCHLTRISEAQ